VIILEQKETDNINQQPSICQKDLLRLAQNCKAINICNDLFLLLSVNDLKIMTVVATLRNGLDCKSNNYLNTWAQKERAGQVVLKGSPTRSFWKKLHFFRSDIKNFINLMRKEAKNVHPSLPPPPPFTKPSVFWPGSLFMRTFNPSLPP
jgi:hypothetical protein